MIKKLHFNLDIYTPDTILAFIHLFHPPNFRHRKSSKAKCSRAFHPKKQKYE